MATRGELTTYVLERLGVSSSRTAFKTQIQNELYRRYVANVRKYNLSILRADLTLTAAVYTVPLPTDWLKTRTIRVASVNLREITFELLSEIRAAANASSAAGGVISRFALYPPSSIYLDVAPDTTSATGGEIFYVNKPAAWTVDADTPAFIPDDFHDLLAEEVIYRMAMNQEEFGTHAAAALQAVGLLSQELALEMKIRSGDHSNRISRAHYG